VDADAESDVEMESGEEAQQQQQQQPELEADLQTADADAESDIEIGSEEEAQQQQQQQSEPKAGLQPADSDVETESGKDGHHQQQQQQQQQEAGTDLQPADPDAKPDVEMQYGEEEQQQQTYPEQNVKPAAKAAFSPEQQPAALPAWQQRPFEAGTADAAIAAAHAAMAAARWAIPAEWGRMAQHGDDKGPPVQGKVTSATAASSSSAGKGPEDDGHDSTAMKSRTAQQNVRLAGKEAAAATPKPEPLVQVALPVAGGVSSVGGSGGQMGYLK
jgi:hypothetical protein